ncbi:S-methyl-5-thioribose-1-phosphate isomerase [Eubacterium coprostanoligenes]|uniref:S-methyl-5-thioribose-1-phosphate isomerase n=1 Tax=Eubacterium coprostanoligenes TaxID=290054 RepID=UPI0023538AEB|nr:S-methyl-5-thioribose-1-phosphate isomerase [Eubacterium coprostanoligenes]MCI6253240.1 S-methyl-5-thioribose-1-phosphate isomerase [Eubacterium coprostanoligenes]MDY5400475.1 S-methyl-5-thioribose-1-phosphate isomerase [Eubacterium coprostanoligenes]
MKNIDYKNGKLFFLDQTVLPNRIEYIHPLTKEDYYYAIKTLQVRGAPAIGIFAGYAMALLDDDKYELKKYLDSARPTAVNLSWATSRMIKAYEDGKDLVSEAIAIHNEDIEMCKKISEYGLSLLKNGDGILTHCNAGALATSEYGTGLGPLLLGKEKGYTFHAYTDETRPLLQGARLTSFELEKAGIDVTLICDNMASLVMKQGKIDAVLVGTDRIAANGDIANKIGTSGVAILAKHYNIPFYVLGPYSTIDYNCPTGDDIVIEEREPNEIKEMWYKEPVALKETKCYNPAFDVTDHELITAIITDRGIIRAPFKENLQRIKDND